MVTWAGDPTEFREKAETVAASMGLYVVDIDDAEPFFDRVDKVLVSEELEELALQARSNPDAILCGTLHTYPFDEA